MGEVTSKAINKTLDICDCRVCDVTKFNKNLFFYHEIPKVLCFQTQNRNQDERYNEKVHNQILMFYRFHIKQTLLPTNERTNYLM